jgi:hypothetical protein
MATSRKRRFVKRAVLAVAGVVLLVSGYVSSWFTVSWAERTGTIAPLTAERLRPAFFPVLQFCESDLPGAGILADAWWRMNPPVVVNAVSGNGEQVSFLMMPASSLGPRRNKAPRGGPFDWSDY